MEEKKVNYWKWAFFVLVGILFISGCYLATKVTSQTKEQTNIAKVSDKNSKQKYTSVDVTLDKKQANATINYYLRKNQKKGKIKYRFLVGKNVSFTLYTKPTLDKNGNILLKVKSVVIGSLNAPAGFILKYVKNNYDLGKVAIIDPKAKTITLDLNQLTKKQDVLVKGTKLDLVNDEFKFNVKVPLK